MSRSYCCSHLIVLSFSLVRYTFVHEKKSTAVDPMIKRLLKAVEYIDRFIPYDLFEAAIMKLRFISSGMASRSATQIECNRASPSESEIDEPRAEASQWLSRRDHYEFEHRRCLARQHAAPPVIPR